MSNLTDKLNKAQLEAVISTEGPVMVMAGAGSGKTRVLTHRIAYIITELGIPSYNILAVTFTNKAAKEMKERLEKLIDVDTRNMWVSTFHSICAKLLRIEIAHLEGYSSNFNIIDEDDGIKIIKEILNDLNLDQKEYKPKSMKKYISDMKNGMISKFDDNNITNVYNHYNQALKKDNLLDFDDLILTTIELFQKCPQILAKYQNKFQYIMVDEFQDTNVSQYKLIYMLSINHHNIFVVGDQDQSIYSFRGAKIENIDKFRKDFLETKVILLEENYRSTSHILNLANKVIDHNPNRIKKNLFTSNGEGQKPAYYQADSSYDEVMFVLDKIKELCISDEYSYKDFAILYRANSLSRSFEDAFVRYKIPYTIYGGMSFFSRKEIKDVIAYLRLIVNHDDDFSFKRIVNEPKRKIGPALLGNLTDVAIAEHESLFKAIDDLKASGQGYNNLLDFKFKIIELLEDLNNEEMDITKIIDIIIEKTGYYDMLKSEGEEGQDRLDNIRELKSVVREADEFYEGTRVEKISQMLSDLALRTDSDNKSEDNDCIKLMTYHQAKGLEYKVVFLVAFEQGIFPSMNSFRKEELEEERRICYVGITRAKERLYITSANSRYLYGSQSMQAPSIYIDEMGYNNLTLLGRVKAKEFVETTKFVKRSEPTISEISKEDYQMGDKINHKAFGDGLVVEVKGDVITVAFPVPYGIKKLISTHPSIRKIK